MFFIAPDCHGQLPTFDKFLYQNLMVILEGFLQGCLQLLWLFYNYHANAGTLRGGLDYHWYTKFLNNLLSQIPFAVFKTEISMGFRGWNPLRHKKSLGRYLVHSNSCRHNSGAGIRNAHHIQSALNNAILAIFAVQRIKDKIGSASLYLLGEIRWIQLQALCLISLLQQGIQNSLAAAARNLCFCRWSPHYNYYLLHKISPTI